MSDCVVDASVLVAAGVDSGSDGRWAETLISRHRLVAPELVLFEVGNVFRRLELKGRLEGAVARLALQSLLALPIDFVPFSPLAARSWQLRRNLTVYDASYVALAESWGCSLATLDRRLGAAPGVRCEVLLPPA